MYTNAEVCLELSYPQLSLARAGARGLPKLRQKIKVMYLNMSVQQGKEEKDEYVE